MRGKTLAPLFLGALMVLPAAATPAAAQEQDLDRFYAERLAELQALWAEPTQLDFAQASTLLGLASEAGLASGEEGLELVKFLRDAEATDAQGDLGRAWVAGMLGREMQAQAWEQDTWDAYGAVLTGVYLVGGTVVPELLPHNLRIPGIHIDLGLFAGCTGNIGRGYCYLRAVADLLALVALDLHFSTDQLLAQLPLAAEVRLNWSCSWTGCRFWFEFLLPETLIASDAAYVFAFPAMTGEFASRVTDMDLLVSAYDRLGGIAWQKAREVTSAAPLAATPLAAAVGETPGLADLHAVAPAPNYYGLQVPPEAPGKPAFPATPALPAEAQALVSQAQAGYGQVNLRVRNDFGTAPVDSLGATVGFTMSQIRAWHLNIAVVRWKNLGTATVPGAPELPASFYYDVGSYYHGGAGNRWTEDYAITETVGL